MTWNNVISFTENNIPYRYKVSTSTAANSDLCNIHVVELDEFDTKKREFHFIYDIKQEMPMADYDLHDKPIQTLLAQMLNLEEEPKNW